MMFQLIDSSFRWLTDAVSSKAQDALLTVLAAGPVPKHIAIVMDGNRRFARRHHIRIPEGHSEGFMALRRMLKICLRLNVRCVSAYAFAIENFKRSPEEVEALMALAEEKLLEICRQGDMLDEYGVRLNVLGKKEYLPPRVQAAIEKAESMTRLNDKAILNICMPYASRDDITTAVQSIVKDASGPESEYREITEDDIDAHLMTSVVGSPPVDILIRTSGVKRLSDFLTWQCSDNTQLQFSSTYWPEFGLWDFVPIILDYQRKVWYSS